MPGFRDETKTNDRRERVFVPQPVVLGQSRYERPVSFLPAGPGLSVMDQLWTVYPLSGPSLCAVLQCPPWRPSSQNLVGHHPVPSQEGAAGPT